MPFAENTIHATGTWGALDIYSSTTNREGSTLAFEEPDGNALKQRILRNRSSFMPKNLYMAKAKTIGGRDGQPETDDGSLKVNLSLPKTLGGPGLPGATKPEQLFAMWLA